MTKPTNQQFLKKAMNYSKFGALKEVFLIQALEKYAAMCIEAGPEALDTSFISGEAWVGVAKEWKEELDAQYAP